MIDLGHRVTIVSGPPYLDIEDDIPVHRIPSLNLYDPANPFRVPTIRELFNPMNLMEWVSVSTMGYPEPFLFGIRAYRFLMRKRHDFDIIHDNQSLSYGVWAINRSIPTVATIHHPITVDREIAVRSASTGWRKMKQMRWYSFIGMQLRVTQLLPQLITVSESAQTDIIRDFNIPSDRITVIPNGVCTTHFHPLPDIPRERGRIIVTNSADMPLKGMPFLLRAVAQISRTREVHLIVVGALKENGSVDRMIHSLGLKERVSFTGRIEPEAFVRQYAKASMAVVPSIYEGFGLPAAEAMLCGVPVVSTTGGALPEVVGDAGLLVPPANTHALVEAMTRLMDQPEEAVKLGEAGRLRAKKKFSWSRAARLTEKVYWRAIRDHRRP